MVRISAGYGSYFYWISTDQILVGGAVCSADANRHTNYSPYYKKISADVRVNYSLTTTLLWY